MREINEANNKQTLQRPLGSHRNEVQVAAQWWRFPTVHTEKWLPSVSSHTAAAPRGCSSTATKQLQLRERYASSRLGSPTASHCLILRFLSYEKLLYTCLIFMFSLPVTLQLAIVEDRLRGLLARSASAATTIRWNKGGRTAVSLFLR